MGYNRIRLDCEKHDLLEPTLYPLPDDNNPESQYLVRNPRSLDGVTYNKPWGEWSRREKILACLAWSGIALYVGGIYLLVRFG